MAKKSLIPCDFITTKGGKEVRLSYDQMRQFLFDNPGMWTPSSTRKIGVGKAQASLGGRGALSSVEATTQALEKIKPYEIMNNLPIIKGKNDYSKEDIKQKIKKIITNNTENVFELIKEVYGETIPIYHASSEFGAKNILENGLSVVPIKNYKSFQDSEGAYFQIGVSDYVADSRPVLFYSEIPIQLILKYADIDVDGGISDKELSEKLDLSIDDIDNANTSARDFAMMVAVNEYKLEGLEMYFNSEYMENPKDFSVKVKQVTPKLISEAYHAAKKDGSNPELVKAVESVLSKEQSPAQQVAALRKQEQAEYDAMPDPKDKAKRQEIYDRYDKLISPLLAEDKAQASLGGRPPVGQISWTKSPEGKGDPSISKRNPVIQKAAQDYKEGKITQDEFGKIIDENRPIEPITTFFEPATEQEVMVAISEDKKEKVGVKVENGEKVGLRLDIPAYRDKNTWVVSVHEGIDEKSGKILSYTNVARIKNVKFISNPLAALNIATGKEKQTIARMIGEWQNIPGKSFEEKGEAAKEIIQEVADNPQWVQVGMNPFRHSYFYDRNQKIGQPIVNAEEVVQVGGLVYAKNPTYAEKADEQFTVKGTNLQFSLGNRGESIADAVIEAGSVFRQTKDVNDAIKAGVAVLTSPKFGYNKAEAEKLIKPIIEKRAAAGFIKIGLIPKEMRDSIDIRTTTEEEMFELGKIALSNNEVNPEELCKSFANGFSRPLSAIEVSALVFYKATLTTRYEKALKELEEANKQKFPDQMRLKQEEVAKLENDLENYYITARKSAYEQGLAFRLRRMLVDRDLNLINMKQEFRAKYGSVSREQTAEMADIEKRLKEIKEREAELELEKEQFKREQAMANLAAQAEEKKKGRDVGAVSDRSFIQKNIMSIVSKIPSGFFGKKKTSGQSSVGRRDEEQTDVEYIWGEAVSRAANALDGIKKVEAADVEKAIDTGVAYIKSTKWYKALSSEEQKDAITAYKTSIKANAKAPSVNVKDNVITIPHKTIREYVERMLEESNLDKNDPDKYQKLMTLVSEAIFADFSSELPLNSTVQDVQEAITRYGVQTYPSKEELEKEVRLMKQVGLKMSQLAAVLSGEKPLKTGYQRDPQAPEARELLRQINEGLKQLEEDGVDNEAFIKSALDKIKTTLNNQIEDLERQIAAGKKKTIVKREVEYDDDAKLLKERRDSLKKVLDDLDQSDKTVKAEQKLARLIDAMEKSIAEYKRRIAEQDFSSFKKMQETLDNLPRVAEYKALTKERELLRKQYNELKRGPKKSPVEIRLEQLEKEYDSLLDGTYQPRQPPVPFDDPRVKELREKISALKKQLGFTKSAEEVKLDRLRKQLSDLLTGTTRTRQTTSPDSADATSLKQQISDVKESLGITRAQEIRRAEKAKETALRKVEERITKLETTGQDVVGRKAIETAYTKRLSEEIEKRNEIVQKLLDDYGLSAAKALKAEKKRIEKYIEEREERMRTGNFNPKPKKQIIADQELIDLRREREKVEERYETMKYKAELAKRNWVTKGADIFLDVWDAPKTAVSGLDMSAPLRQGLFEVLTQNPVTVAKAFKFMFQSTFDVFSDEKTAEEKYEKWLDAVKNSPEYYEMKAAKLYLALPNAKLSAKEESFVNKLIYQVPLIQRPIGGVSMNLYKKSERAYNSFLNYLRYAAFTEVMDAWKNMPEPITMQSNPEEYKALAEIINISTGRPNLGGLESSATAINRLVFSVRLMWSRFLLVFLPFRAAFMPPAARKYAMLKWMRGMGSLAAIYFLINLYLDNDDDDETYVEFDPRGGFLNANINKSTKFNLTAGMSQWVSLLSKLGMMEYKKKSTGEIRDLGASPYDPTWIETLAGFFVGKAAPTPRVFLEYFLSTPNEQEGGRITAFGERYSVTESLGNLAVPLIINDIGKTAEDNTAFSIASLGLLAFFGGSVNVSSERYKLPSEVMFEALHPGEKEFNLGNEKVTVAIKDDDTEKMKKLFEKQVAIRAEKYRQDGANVDTTDEYGPVMDRIRAEYAIEIFNRLASDKIVQKTGLKDSEMRQAFFLIMSGKPFDPIPEWQTEEEKEMTIKMRQKLTSRFDTIPLATRENVVRQYSKQAKDRERISSEMNKLNIKTYQGNKVDFNKLELDGTDSDWLFEYKMFENSPNFKKITNQK